MSVYCANNPINFIDSEGKSRESLLKKAHEIQIILASGKPTNYSIGDVLYYLKQAEKNDFQKTMEWIGAFVCSSNLEIGFGVGIGNKTNILGFDGELYAKCDPLNIRINQFGIDVGKDTSYGMSIGYKAWDLGFSDDKFESYVPHKTTYNGDPSGKLVLIDESVYAGVGFTLSGYFDMNYVVNRIT